MMRASVDEHVTAEQIAQHFGIDESSSIHLRFERPNGMFANVFPNLDGRFPLLKPEDHQGASEFKVMAYVGRPSSLTSANANASTSGSVSTITSSLPGQYSTYSGK